MRRSAGAVLALGLLTGCSSGAEPAADAAAEERPEIRIAVAPSVPLSVPLTGLAASPVATDTAGVRTETARTPDDFRAMFTSGSVDLATMPTAVAANLAARDVPIRVLGVVDSALLKVVGPAGVQGWDALRGQTVRIPFRGDAADLTFQILAAENGLVPGRDVTIEYGSTLPDTVSEIIAGRVPLAVLPEHFATLTRTQAGLGEVLDLQTEWTRSTGSGSLPQSAVVVAGEFADRHPELVARIAEQMRETTERISAGATDAERAEIAQATGAPEPMVGAVLPTLRLGWLTRDQARDDITTMLNRFLELSPDSVGGRLPDEAFLRG
ncbi:MqnA/MqnD/SBP family protein [Pseudonocardia sp. NPDC049635]|uniref:ABC transporter substrate-binding protein n=1 Tax=Pseudonocardia sp. NPDC049635 TaxID=3155506 RepID=UPI0033F3A466